jgi:uncharacterized protein DUF4229
VARLGLFAAVAVLLIALPLPVAIFLKLAIAVLVSAILSWMLLGNLREQVARQLSTVAKGRQARRQQLRDALSGDDEIDGDAAAREPGGNHS